MQPGISGGLEMIDSVLLRGIVFLWLAACAMYDVRSGEVPNVLTVPALAAAAVVAALSGWDRLLIFGLSLAVVLGFYSVGVMGGADAKILAALSGFWPEWMVMVIIGMILWTVGRRLMRRDGNFRAVLPMFLAILIGVVGDAVG